MKPYEKVLQVLNDLNIPYKMLKHPPAMTTEEADRYIEGHEGVRTKSLFLCNKKSRSFYLLMMDDQKSVDMKALENILEDRGLHFGSEEKLAAKMGLTPGSVSVFGLLNNEEKDIHVLFDAEIMAEPILTFHPNDNTKTLFVSTKDILRFLEYLEFSYRAINLQTL